MAGPDNDPRGLDLFQFAAVAPRVDGERTRALTARRADGDIALQHRPDAKRVDGAHGAHRETAGLHVIFGRTIGERIGAAYLAGSVDNEEIASGQALQHAVGLIDGEPGRCGDIRDLWSVPAQGVAAQDDAVDSALGLI